MVDRESVRLAFVAALQHLTPAQRAVLILRDVLAWQASEVAALLEISVAAVNSSLQRARAHRCTSWIRRPSGADLDDDRAKELLADYVAAFEHYDIARIVELLAEDAVWEMPPYVGWYRGTRRSARSSAATARPRGRRPGAGSDPGNGQPAFGLYMRQPDGSYAAFQLQVLTLDGDQVSHVSVFFDLRLFEKFGLPATVDADMTTSCPSPRRTGARRTRRSPRTSATS